MRFCLSSAYTTHTTCNRRHNVDTPRLGVAAGAKRDLIDIIALNVRTEIVFGQFSDGCTSLYYQGDGNSFQGQNWDVRTYLPTYYPSSSDSDSSHCRHYYNTSN